MRLPAIPRPKIQALRALHLSTPRIHLPKLHVPSIHPEGLGMGGVGKGLSGSGRVQGAPRMNLRIPSFIRKPTL